MKKSAAAKKISDKEKKQAIEKKIKKALRTPQKAAAKKKKVTATTPRAKTKKTPAKKSRALSTQQKGAVTARKKEAAAKKIKKVAPKTAGTPEKVRAKPAKKQVERPLAKTKKSIAPKPPVKKSLKKVSGPAKKEIPERQKPVKVVKKPIAKKVPAKKTKTVAVQKPVVKPKKAAGKAAPEKEEKKKKTTRHVVGRTRKKAPAEAKKQEEKIPPLSVQKTQGAIRQRPEAVRLKPPIMPDMEIKYPPVPWEHLPAEYGENAVTLMTVNPFRLFSFWEVREDTLRIFRGGLMLRIYDVTGIDIDTNEPNSFFDITLSDRVGSLYIDVVPERAYIAEVGILYEGIFVGIAKSAVAETPRSLAMGEGTYQSQAETGERVGY